MPYRLAIDEIISASFSQMTINEIIFVSLYVEIDEITCVSGSVHHSDSSMSLSWFPYLYHFLVHIFFANSMLTSRYKFISYVKNMHNTLNILPFLSPSLHAFIIMSKFFVSTLFNASLCHHTHPTFH